MIEELLQPEIIAIVGAAILVALLIRHPRSLAFSSPCDPSVKQVPGLPLLGNTITILRGRDRLLNLFLDWQRTYGEGGKPFSATFPPFGRIYMINRPQYIEYIQKKNFDNYPKGRFFRSLFSDLLGEHGIFVADGDVWKRERKTASSVFSAGSFRTHVTAALNKELDVLKDLYRNLADSGKSVNLQDIHFRFTLATFGVFAFDDGFDTLSSNPSKLEKPVEFAQAFDYAQHVVDGRVTNPFWKPMELLTPGGRRMARATKTIHSYAYKLVDKHLAGEKTEKEDGHQNLLALFMKLTDDRTVLMETCLNFIIAGRDTTAQALSWWFYYLISKPDVVKKIRAEVDKVIGKDKRVDYDNMKELVYTTACFYETLRLNPSVPKNMKFVADNDVIEGDDAEGIPSFHVNKGDTVILSDWVMGRMPEVWGPDAAEYKPDRWIDDEGKLRKEPGQRFHAFNFGPRLCLGQTLATFEAVSVVAEVTREFDIEFAKPVTELPLYANSLTLPIRDPYDVQFKRRKAA